MNRRAQRTRSFGNELTLQDAFTDADNWLSRVADMLRYRQNEL
jgi:hypothetical protein